MVFFYIFKTHWKWAKVYQVRESRFRAIIVPDPIQLTSHVF